MNAKLGKAFCPSIEEQITISSEPTNVSRIFLSDYTEYMVATLKSFSNRPQMTFSSDSVKFYRSHFTLIEFTKKYEITILIRKTRL